MAAYSAEFFLFGFTAVLVLFAEIRGATYSIPYDSIADCTSSQYFNLAELSCKDCGQFQTSSTDGNFFIFLF